MQHKTDKSRKVVMMVACPICGEELQPKGLHGHLRFKHGLSGDKLDKTYEGNVSVERKREEKRAKIDRITSLHDELRNVRSKRDGLKDDDRSGFFSSDDAVEKLRKLYDAEEKRIKSDLAELLGEAGAKDDDDDDLFF